MSGSHRSVAVLLAVMIVLSLATSMTGCSKESPAPTASPATTAATRDAAKVDETVHETVAAAIIATESIEETQSIDTPDDPTESAEISVPENMDAVLLACGYTAEDLYDIGCRQLVTVDSSGSSATIRFFTFDDRSWSEDEALACSGYVGRNGVTTSMHEGGMATPFGLYTISEAFYINEKPATGLPTFRITDDTYWVDDPDSAYYNRRVEGTGDRDWSSAEHMIDYPATYEYGFVIDYNTEAAYAAGSAIFFHIKYEPTYGCVATDRDSVLGYLAALRAEETPCIVII